MNIEITDELAIELADAHAATFYDVTAVQRLIDIVGVLLVYIDDPRGAAPARPVVAPVVERIMHRPKAKLTPNQREVYDRLARISRRRSDPWVPAANIGSKNTCARLAEKGWIEIDIHYGPRGGELRYYRPTTEEN